MSTFIATPIPGLTLIEPRIFGDDRGYFYESYNAHTFQEAGIGCTFQQDNQSRSKYGVLRGLHYQCDEHTQAKLVRVLEGKVLDVVVDIRPDSPTYGQSYRVELSAANQLQLFIPQGMAHGFAVLSEAATFYYKCDNFYHPASEGGIYYADATLGIDWSLSANAVVLSEKDAVLPPMGSHRPVGITLAQSLAAMRGEQA